MLASLPIIAALWLLCAATPWSEGSRPAVPSHDGSVTEVAGSGPLAILTEEERVVASDGAVGDMLGYWKSGDPTPVDAWNDTHIAAVSLSGDTLLVGASRNDESGSDAGAAYVFVWDGAMWTEEAKILDPGAVPAGYFGSSVALDGDTAVIGARGTTTVYVFTRSGTTWSLEEPLFLDGVCKAPASVALDGDTLFAAGTCGAVGTGYVYVRSGTAWNQVATLAYSGPSFGMSSDLDGGTLVVGVPFYVGAGGAVIWERSGTTWPDDPVAIRPGTFDGYGTGVAVSGDTVALSSEKAHTVKIFARSGSVWNEQQTLTSADDDSFGSAVALEGDRLVIGARRSGVVATGAGVAQVYERSGISWTKKLDLYASDATSDDQLGAAVALGGDRVVVAAPFAEVRGFAVGAVYIFTASSTLGGDPDGTACVISDTCHSGFCVDGLCCASACGGGVTEDCQACAIAAGGQLDGACTSLTSATAAATLCRPGSGDCDTPEYCRQGEATCPEDRVFVMGTVCRGAIGACDTAETCDGESPACPPDVGCGPDEDAGPRLGVDAGPGGTIAPPPSKSGCGCKVTGRSGSSRWAPMALLLLAVCARRRFL